MIEATCRAAATVVPFPAARGPEPRGLVQCERAEVVGGTPDLPLVALGATQLSARRALSCLLRPEPGDRVLIAAAGGELWVLAVLERTSEAPVRVAIEGDLEIASMAGHLSLVGGAGVDIATPATARVAAGALALHARSARVLIDDILHIGQSLCSHAARLKLVGQTMEAIIDRVMTRAKRSFRFVEEGDHLRATNIDHRAGETLHLSAHNAFVTAGGVMKLDGEQIHMG